jgi:hypothetical protein
MARIGDVQQPLRGCARLIPKDILLRLDRWEVVTRTAFAQSLYDQAAGEAPAVAEKTRIMAERVLRSLPVDEYLARVAYYDSCLQTAARAENADECARAYAALCQLQWSNIYPSEDALSVIAPGIAAEMAFGNTAASRAAGFKAAR